MKRKDGVEKFVRGHCVLCGIQITKIATESYPLCGACVMVKKRYELVFGTAQKHIVECACGEPHTLTLTIEDKAYLEQLFVQYKHTSRRRTQ
jgi:hypothetical protein